ncbi:MAG: exodeoxyribonuclease VII small subunit [Bifidobacteriaceae bacterium]|jgi:exodeoxyribonuclease VII small subunit|nr:exodeoxyribonuclease VII small subunit [Bifidobacteriaceae bacterium]
MALQNSDGNDLATLSYEQARAELVAQVQSLEAGEGTLEESLAAWERGEALAARCQALLDQARQRLDKAGTLSTSADSASADQPDKERP